MKRILFLLTILSLFAYGCNRDEQPAGGATGMQEEEQLGTDSQAFPEDEVAPEATVEEVDPAMQEEQTRPEDMQTDPALEQDPSMDPEMQDPGMQEEEIRGEEPGTFDPAMEEPIEDTEVVE